MPEPPDLLLLPGEAVVLRDDGPVVWVKRGLGWREVPVELGRRNHEMVEVLDGLSEGDAVSTLDLAGPRGAGDATGAAS